MVAGAAALALAAATVTGCRSDRVEMEWRAVGSAVSGLLMAYDQRHAVLLELVRDRDDPLAASLKAGMSRARALRPSGDGMTDPALIAFDEAERSLQSGIDALFARNVAGKDLDALRTAQHATVVARYQYVVAVDVYNQVATIFPHNIVAEHAGRGKLVQLPMVDHGQMPVETPHSATE